MTIGKSEIRSRFGYHRSTEETIAQHNRVREAYIALAEFLDEVLPDGRAKSTAFTKLQESSMWSNYGIAENGPVVAPRPARPKGPVPRPPQSQQPQPEQQ